MHVSFVLIFCAYAMTLIIGDIGAGVDFFFINLYHNYLFLKRIGLYCCYEVIVKSCRHWFSSQSNFIYLLKQVTSCDLSKSLSKYFLQCGCDIH